jgi:hypothetical protein
MIKASTENPWMARYVSAMSPEVIRQRTQRPGRPLRGLREDFVEVACERMSGALEGVFIATASICEIIQGEVERALAFCLQSYPTTQVFLQTAYAPPVEREMHWPTCITGPAGTGKSELAKAIRRLFSGESEVFVDAEHGTFAHRPFALLQIKGRTSVRQFLLPLAKPEIAAGTVRIAECNMADECSKWLYLNGTCLIGIDELQFMTQSAQASTLVSQAMLTCADIGKPWFYIANYSLCWRLKRRPQEATQRLLNRVVVLLPDSATSPDWLLVLKEYSVVVADYFDFSLPEKAHMLWNLCAGLKRLLVRLLVQAYRLARKRGVGAASWADVQAAYASEVFSTSREDVDALIRYAAQGGELEEDLRCPFVGGAISVAADAYAKDLRSARAERVAAAARDASMTAEERKIMQSIATKTKTKASNNGGELIKLKRREPRTLESLQEAGRRFREEPSSKGS